MLAKLLRQSPQKYDVWILNTGAAEFVEKRPSYLDNVQVAKFTEAYLSCDLIIGMGAQIDNVHIAKFHESGPHKKFILYKCGTDMLLRVENILFKENVKRLYQIDRGVDAVFYIPQQDFVNKGYYRTVYRTNAFVVPFVWDPQFLDAASNEIDKNYYQSKDHGNLTKGVKYDPNRNKDGSKSILVCEPNLNVVKTCLYPLLIAEEVERKKPNMINKIFLSSTLEKLAQNHDFLALCGSLDIQKKIRAEGRYQISFVLSQYADIVVSHQFLNPLNYLPLDTCHLGYPLLHNMEYLKDLGYYYEGSDTKAAGEMLQFIIEHHDEHLEEYQIRNSRVLNRYKTTNPQLIATYDVLLHELFNGGVQSRSYNPLTNLYE